MFRIGVIAAQSWITAKGAKSAKNQNPNLRISSRSLRTSRLILLDYRTLRDPEVQREPHHQQSRERAGDERVDDMHDSPAAADDGEHHERRAEHQNKAADGP